MKAFFDTNILIYALGGTPAKLEAAQGLLRGGGVISVQVLNEFISVTRGKMKQSWEDIDAALLLLRALDLDIVPATLAAHDAAAKIARDQKFRIHDAMIIASAQEAGCDTLWTEDLSHGQRFGTLVVQNPFLMG